MSWLKEFRDFAMRGNVVDMAVGVIIGTSFGKITTSLVGDVLMPPIGILLSKVDFKGLTVDIGFASDTGEPVTIKYGMFITTVIDFILVAIVVFSIVKVMNTLKRLEEGTPKPAPPSTKTCPECRSTIAIDATRCSFCTIALTASNTNFRSF